MTDKELKEQLDRIEMEVAKNREILDQTVVKLLDALLHINIAPTDATAQLIQEAKKRTQ